MTTTISKTSTTSSRTSGGGTGRGRRRQPTAGVGRLVRRLERERRTWTRRPDREPGGADRGGVAGRGRRGAAAGAGRDPEGGLSMATTHTGQRRRAGGRPDGGRTGRPWPGSPSSGTPCKTSATPSPRPQRAAAERRVRATGAAATSGTGRSPAPTRSAPRCKRCQSLPADRLRRGQAVRAAADREGLEALTWPSRPAARPDHRQPRRRHAAASRLAMRDIPIRRGSFKKTHDNLARDVAKSSPNSTPPAPSSARTSTTSTPAPPHFRRGSPARFGPAHIPPFTANGGAARPVPKTQPHNADDRSRRTMTTQHQGTDHRPVRHTSVRGSTRPTGPSSARWAGCCRHPLFAAPPAARGPRRPRLGRGRPVGYGLAGLVAVLLVWWRAHPASFDRWAAPRHPLGLAAVDGLPRPALGRGCWTTASSPATTAAPAQPCAPACCGSGRSPRRSTPSPCAWSAARTCRPGPTTPPPSPTRCTPNASPSPAAAPACSP